MLFYFSELLKNKILQTILSFLIFIFWIVLFYQKIGLQERLHERPHGEHAWAQIDRASMALTYYMDDPPFLLPRCHQATGNPDGITAGEFPIIPYIVSKFYRLWGFNEFYHRTFVLFIGLLGFIFSFFLALKWIKNPFWASFVSSVWLASPNIIYYSITFLPDVPSLAFLCMAFFFFLRKRENLQRLDILLFSFFLSISALIKVSSLLPAAAVLIAYLITHYKLSLKTTKAKLIFIAASAIPVILSVIWILYARKILDQYHIFTFLLEPLPPKNWEEFKSGFLLALNLLDFYYIDGFRLFLIGSTFFGLFFIKRSNMFLLLSAFLIYLSGFFIFLVLFEKAPTHGYYWIPFQLGVLFHVAWAIDLFVKSMKVNYLNYLLFAIAMVFINYNAIHVQKNFSTRWGKNDQLYNPYYDLEKKLDMWGVGYNERIFSFADGTFNNTLYLMNRKGWPVNQGFSKEKMALAFQSCTYAVLNDTSILSNQEYKQYFSYKIGTHKNLVIYKLHVDERTNSSSYSP